MSAVLLAILLGLLVIDWRQTLVIAQPGGWYERNPAIVWLAERYGAAGVHSWFALVIACALAAFWLLQGDAWLPWLVGLCCAIEAVPVISNYWLGIRP